MGQQIYIRTIDLLKLKFKVSFQLSEGPDFYDYQATIEPPAIITGLPTCFYMSISGYTGAGITSLWSDYNAWGSNIARIKPFIDYFKIPHTIS